MIYHLFLGLFFQKQEKKSMQTCFVWMFVRLRRQKNNKTSCEPIKNSAQNVVDGVMKFSDEVIEFVFDEYTDSVCEIFWRENSQIDQFKY